MIKWFICDFNLYADEANNSQNIETRYVPSL